MKSNRLNRRTFLWTGVLGASVVLTNLSSSAALAQAQPRSSSAGAVYAMTNEAVGNRVMVYDRAGDGTLTLGATVETGGTGSGTFENTAGGLILTGQSPDNLGGGNNLLFATNAGSNSVSVFRVKSNGDLILADVKPSGGTRPISVTFRRKMLYVLNGGGSQGSGPPPSISGFTVGSMGELTPIPGSTRPVTSGPAAGVAQIGFNKKGNVLIVTERGQGAIIDTYVVDQNGIPSGPIANTDPSIMGPFGFTFTQRDQLLVCMNRGGAMGLGAASSFEVPDTGVLVPISGPVANMRSDTCWFVVTDNNKFGFVTNFQSGDLSSYRVQPDGTLVLLNPVAGVVGLGSADQAFSGNSQYLYVRVISDGTIRVFEVDPSSGNLTPIQTIGGLPPGAAIGIAAK